MQTFKKDCEICKASIPFRGKHCRRCGQCVRKFDHHCFLIEGCVGEENHFRFIVYLFFQSITVGLSFINILDNISYQLSLNQEKYSKVPFALYINILILFVYALFVGILFFFHLYLISTSQVTYEIYYKNTIEHIKFFASVKKDERNHLPFDLGFADNIKSTFFGKTIDWENIYFTNITSKRKKFNWCHNEYWSCF